MKTVLKFTVMAALLMNTVTAMANEPKMKLVADSDTKSLVFELDEVSKDAKIQFLDSENNIIYSSSSFKSNVLRTKYDLSKLEEGVYTLRMDSISKEIVYTILIDGSSISVIETSETNKPSFRIKDGMVFINFFNKELKNVDIKVYDESDRILHSEVVSNKLIVEKAINFKNAYKGNYTVTIKSTDGVYSENISI
tara:strand:+ start:582 stop:1166 length:585 start_codon:yes stop_codon:yes gene_type:complete